MSIWLCMCMFLWKVVSCSRRESTELETHCLPICMLCSSHSYLPPLLCVLLLICVHQTASINIFSLFANKELPIFFLLLFFLSPLFSNCFCDVDLLIVSLNNRFWWHVSMSLRVCWHIFVCLAGGNKGSKSRVGFYDEIQWQFEVSNHWTREWEKDGMGGKAERWKERNRWEEREREGRRVRGDKRLQKERLSKERER